MLRVLLTLTLVTFGCAYYYHGPPPFWDYPSWDEQGLVRYSFEHPYQCRAMPATMPAQSFGMARSQRRPASPFRAAAAV
jgi:hypothetical protein